MSSWYSFVQQMSYFYSTGRFIIMFTKAYQGIQSVWFILYFHTYCCLYILQFMVCRRWSSLHCLFQPNNVCL